MEFIHVNDLGEGLVEAFKIGAVVFVLELLVRFLTSGGNKFTKVTKGLLAPISYLTDAMEKGKRSWIVLIVATLASIAAFVGFVVMFPDAGVDTAIGNIPFIAALIQLNELENATFADFALIAVTGIVLTLLADSVQALVVGEDNDKQLGYVLCYAFTLLLFSGLVDMAADKIGLLPFLNNIFESGNVVVKTIAYIVFGYLLISAALAFFEEFAFFLIFFNIVNTLYSHAGLGILDNKLFGNVTMEDLLALPAWKKILPVVVFIVITYLISNIVTGIMQKRYEDRGTYSRGIAEALCVFGGSMGLHYFYVGRIKRGLVYWVTYGLFGIGSLIDIVKIARGKFKDKKGKYVKKW